MAKDLNFSSDELLNFKFKAVDRGYDPDQVDSILDKIIEDYRQYELDLKNDNDNLLNQIAELKKLNAELNEQLLREKNRVKYLPRDQKDVHLDNYELLIRIGKLEKFISDRLNTIPDEIK